MTTTPISPARTAWHEQVTRLQAELETLSGQLVEQEAALSERLAAISAFEFTLRARIGHLSQKLDELDDAIKTLKQQLRRLGDDWFDNDAPFDTTESWSMGDAAAEGDYRYRQAHADAEAPPVALSQTETADLKALYRTLARRFHPDLALDAADRERCTQLMMAINAAYAAGDLARLQQLAQEPDAADRIEHAQTDEQLAAALAREIERIQARLAEIKQELARLNRHRSAKMMREAARADAAGRDYFAGLAARMQKEIAARQAQRDSLQIQLDEMDLEDELLSDADLADVVWDVSLEQSLEEDTPPELDRFIQRRRDRVYFEDDFDDDVDYD